MANLSIRKLDESVYKKLKAQAESHGVSMEEETRQILSNTFNSNLNAKEGIADTFLKLFGPKNGVDLELPDRGPPHEPIDFSE